MHQSSLEKMWYFRKKYLSDKEQEQLQVLDLGSMDVNGSYRECFDNASWTYLGMDQSPGKNVDIVLSNPYAWREIKSAAIDVLVSGQAFEHIDFFWITALEIARVLKPGGWCCIIAPSSGAEHKYPVDCWRFYPDGFSALARYIGFEIKELFTQWEDDAAYSDCSNNWHDTIMIARNPASAGFKRLRHKLRRTILHRILSLMT